MKKMMCISLVLTAVMLLLPLNVMKEEAVIPTTAVMNEVSSVKTEAYESFRVCDAETGQVEEMSAKDYIFGVVSAEMPALYEEEALKAQAIAAYTFACRRKSENADKTYDITTDPTTDQCFITEEDAAKRWGSKADEYTEKIKSIVSDTQGLMITYKGEPITAVYHAISSGKTESCKNVWGTELEYLKPVASEGDKLSPDYVSELSFSAEQLKERLADELELTGEPSEYFGKTARTDSGTVKEITVCGEKLTGARLRSLLELRSSNFEVAYADGKFTFTVYGYGHGVGMSQNGANYMAKQGSGYEEILKHYYTGCEINKIG